MTARYAIADIEYPEAVQILDRLPPGHHHVHVGEDGTVTAVPMRRAVEEDEPVMVEVFTGTLYQHGVRLWVDAPGETPT